MLINVIIIIGILTSISMITMLEQAKTFFFQAFKFLALKHSCSVKLSMKTFSYPGAVLRGGGGCVIFSHIRRLGPFFGGSKF